LLAPNRTESILFAAVEAHHVYPSWSADGRLAYCSNGRNGAYEAVDGIFLLQGNDPGRVAWTSSGSLVVTLPAISGGDLYLADPVAQTLIPLVKSASGEIYDQPALSADGSMLAYVRRGTGPSGKYEEGIWVAQSDGQAQRRLTTGNFDDQPAWSSDGRSVLLNRARQGLFLYDLDTDSLLQVTQRPVDYMAWNPL